MSSDPEHRHRCEVRCLIVMAKKEGRQAVKDYLDHKNVAPRAPQLRLDLNAQIKAKNTGKPGEWIEGGSDGGS
jgi:hypothetical protein